ncbi:MAG: endolytic transglycosylase MltG, partial [Deltaproteobacteria bacterium]|nr:endolytic transglycosylase MltG [Deltaproteobacteria bacterium]
MTNEAHKQTRFSGKTKWIVLLGSAFFFLLCLLLAAVWVHRVLQPVNTTGENRDFVVDEGATLNRVAEDLKTAQLIRSSTLFRLAGRFKGYEHHIKTGEYRLNGAMPPLKILEILKEGRIITHPITIPEGFTLNQIADLL